MEASMKIFIVSTRGDSAPMARKLLSEGHSVEMYVKDKGFRKYMEPDVPLIKSPTWETVNSDLMIVEDAATGKFADRARGLKRLVIGGGVVADQITCDLDFNERSLHGCGFTLAGPNTQGVLMEVGGWFDGEKYLRPYFMGFKSYHLGTGDVGPLTLGMGIAGKYAIKGRLFTDVLHKTETLFRSMHYVGYAAIEGFVNKESFRAVRLHSKLQFPITNALGDLHTTWGTFLLKLATKQAEVVAVQPDRVVVGVNMLLRGYFENSGSEQYKLICASGQDIAEAKSKAYRAVARENIPNAYYRIDIGDNFTSNLERLHEGAWI